jgi:sulfur carrier protein ThiS
LEAATALVGELVAATMTGEATIAVEYDGEVVPWIERGRADDGIEVGLLGAWRRALDA